MTRKKPESVVNFEAAMPLKSHGRYDWVQIASDLRAHPGEWGMVFDLDRTSIVNAVRQGSIRVLAPDLGFEVRTRRNVLGEVRSCQLWMRHVPEKEDPVKAAIVLSRED